MSEKPVPLRREEGEKWKGVQIMKNLYPTKPIVQFMACSLLFSEVYYNLFKFKLYKDCISDHPARK